MFRYSYRDSIIVGKRLNFNNSIKAFVPTFFKTISVMKKLGLGKCVLFDTANDIVSAQHAALTAQEGFAFNKVLEESGSILFFLICLKIVHK